MSAEATKSVTIDDRLDRDGHQHSVGLDQLFSLPEPLGYAQLGVLWSRYNPQGEEYEHDAYEVVAGLGAPLPWQMEASLLYRFSYRDYRHDQSFFNSSKQREDHAHRLGFAISLPIQRRWEATLAGSFTFNSSNVSTFDYDRQIVSTVLTYSF